MGLRLIGFPTKLLDHSRWMRGPAPAREIETCDGRIRVAIGVEPRRACSGAEIVRRTGMHSGERRLRFRDRHSADWIDDSVAGRHGKAEVGGGSATRPNARLGPAARVRNTINASATMMSYDMQKDGHDAGTPGLVTMRP
jgi:hypothetical protein